METLKTPQGTFTIYINPLNSPEGRQFHISFIDKQNKLHIVLMKRKEGVWVLAEPEKHPDWIKDLHCKFDELIIREQLRTHLPLAMAG
jgi:hypothetical protein